MNSKNNEDKNRDGWRIFESLNDRGGNAARIVDAPGAGRTRRRAGRRANYQ
jgi:hypothetical protein